MVRRVGRHLMRRHVEAADRVQPDEGQRTRGADEKFDLGVEGDRMAVALAVSSEHGAADGKPAMKAARTVVMA